MTRFKLACHENRMILFLFKCVNATKKKRKTILECKGKILADGQITRRARGTNTHTNIS